MNEQQPEGATNPQEQSDKPLGRGLEQISHLFLSQRAGGPRPGEPARAPELGPQAQSAPHGGRTTLLQPSTSVSKDRIVAVLKDNTGALEDGLRVIDIFIRCHPHSDINLLALNRANQLIAIDIETSINDALVVLGLAHLDWLRHNRPNIRRMYPQQNIVVTSEPQLFLVAPKFSSLALKAARSLASMQIYCFSYHAFDIGDATGIFFEPVDWK